MPVFFFYGPDLDQEKKREFVKVITEKASEILSIDKERFSIHLRPHPKENVAVGGELMTDREERERREKNL